MKRSWAVPGCGLTAWGVAGRETDKIRKRRNSLFILTHYYHPSTPSPYAYPPPARPRVRCVHAWPGWWRRQRTPPPCIAAARGIHIARNGAAARNIRRASLILITSTTTSVCVATAPPPPLLRSAPRRQSNAPCSTRGMAAGRAHRTQIQPPSVGGSSLLTAHGHPSSAFSSTACKRGQSAPGRQHQAAVRRISPAGAAASSAARGVRSNNMAILPLQTVVSLPAEFSQNGINWESENFWDFWKNRVKSNRPFAES